MTKEKCSEDGCSKVAKWTVPKWIKGTGVSYKCDEHVKFYQAIGLYSIKKIIKTKEVI